jgi:hypothetical protein
LRELPDETPGHLADQRMCEGTVTFRFNSPVVMSRATCGRQCSTCRSRLPTISSQAIWSTAPRHLVDNGDRTCGDIHTPLSAARGWRERGARFALQAPPRDTLSWRRAGSGAVRDRTRHALHIFSATAHSQANGRSGPRSSSSS